MRAVPTVLCSVAVALSFAAPARADLGHLVRAGTSMACTGLTPCTVDSMCTGPLESCRALTDASGVTSGYCARDPVTEVFCCTGSSDCPVVGGHMATCANPLSPIAVIPGLCLFMPTSYCIVDPTVLTSTDLGRIAACHSMAIPPCVVPPPPMSSLFVDLAMGDCDHDGIANASDTRPCVPDTTPCASDGGILLDAGGDGGHTTDAGTDLGATFDAGGGPDAGPAPDAGAEGTDLGGTGEDAAAAPPGTSFRGAGGCACSVAGGSSRGALPALAALGLTLVALRPRRRQSQR